MSGDFTVKIQIPQMTCPQCEARGIDWDWVRRGIEHELDDERLESR